MNHTAEELLQVPASDVVLPGVAQSGWLSKQSDWLKSWNARWLVLWPVGQPTASQLSRSDSLGFHAAAEGGILDGPGYLLHRRLTLRKMLKTPRLEYTRQDCVRLLHQRCPHCPRGLSFAIQCQLRHHAFATQKKPPHSPGKTVSKSEGVHTSRRAREALSADLEAFVRRNFLPG